jgi:hypothetical protein
MPCLPKIADLAGAVVSVYVGDSYVGMMPLTVIRCESRTVGHICYAFLTAKRSQIPWRNRSLMKENDINVREYFHPETLGLLRRSEGRDKPATHVLTLPCETDGGTK